MNTSLVKWGSLALGITFIVVGLFYLGIGNALLSLILGIFS